MAAPTNAANVKKALANSEPSTHGTKRTSVPHRKMSANDPKRIHRGRKHLHFMFFHRSLSLAAGKVISKIDPYG